MRLLYDIAFQDRDLPDDYLFDYEKMLDGQNKPKKPSKSTATVLFMSTVVLRVFIKALLLRILDFDLANLLEESKPILQNNCKAVAAFMYRMIRNVWSTTSAVAAGPSEQVLLMIAKAPPATDPKWFSDEYLKAIEKKLEGKADVWVQTLRSWAEQTVNELEQQ